MCRYRSNIEPATWLIIEGQKYNNILYVMDPPNKERLEIFTEVVIYEYDIEAEGLSELSRVAGPMTKDFPSIC